MDTLIASILDAVFSSLAESVGASDWLRDRFGRDPEKLAFRAALTQALTDAAQHFPGRDLRYFAEQLGEFGGPVLARSLQPASPLPTAAELTDAWLTHLNLDSKLYYKADFERFATILLESLHNHIENQQPLQWIAQLRTQKITADAAQRSAETAEQSATLLAITHNEIQRLQERLERQIQTNTEGGAAIGGNVHTGGDFIGRDHITIRNYFTNGLGRLHIDYSARIEEFLLEYLGSRRKKVPFGGRATQLNKLDAWLNDRNAPPYYLMTAEAGRGKSALVCRWQAQLLTRPDVEVIFIPISIRFETATQDVVFAALAARLAAIHGDEMKPAVLSADQWRATCQSYLRRVPSDGKQLVVILDGLDEATGWTPGRGLFPGDPPEGLRVLVSARQRAGELGPEGWAATLGWDEEWLARKEILKGLDRTGVQEALVSMGNPLDKLATQVDVIGEFFRLTEGDPLLVRLYVDALVGKGMDTAYLRAEELKAIQPGLQGYFDRWWYEQYQQWTNEGRDPIVEQEHLLTLLNAVASALGPLTYSDLAAVSNLTNGLLVRRLTQTVSRWLIGDGTFHGYTFSHPRLGYYFWEQLGEAEQSGWDARFTEWGTAILAALNSGEVVPKAAPRYLVQHYAEHLTRADAPAEEFYPLMSDGWRQAWEEVDITYSGFLSDVTYADAKAQTAYHPQRSGKAEALVQQIKAALCRSSISALSHNITPKLLCLTLIHKLRTPAQIIATIQLMYDDTRRGQALVALAPHISVEIITAALTIARAIGNESDCVNVLASLTPYVPETQKQEVLTEALTIARAMGNESDRAKALAVLASHLPETQKQEVLTEALASARTIRHELPRALALATLVPHLSETQQLEVLTAALAAATAIGDKAYSAYVLVKLAPHLPAELLAEALASARMIRHELPRVRALAALAPHLPTALLPEALAAARAMRNVVARTHALAALAPHLTETQKLEVLTEALAAATTIGDEADRADVLTALTPHLPETQQLEVLTEALAAATTIGDVYANAHVLVALAPHLPSALLTEALAVARMMRNAARSNALAVLAPYLSKAQQIEVLTEALATARAIEYEADRAHALVALAPYLPTALLMEALIEALAAAREIKYESDRANLLAALAPHLPEAQQLEVLTEALVAARAIEHKADRADVLAALAYHLPEAQKQEVLTEALAAAQAIWYDSIRTRALAALTPHLPKAQELEVLTEVLVAVRAMGNESDRADVLALLAPHLPAALLTDALTAAKAMANKTDRADVLAALAPHLPEAQQLEVLTEALAAARAIEYEADRAHVLTTLAPHLSKVQQLEVLTEALAAASAIGDVVARAHALAALAPHLSAWGRNNSKSAYRQWISVIWHLSQRPRPGFQRDMEILMDFTLSLAGDEASQTAAGIFRALRDVSTWWP